MADIALAVNAATGVEWRKTGMRDKLRLQN
jgi:hypothetical protein